MQLAKFKKLSVSEQYSTVMAAEHTDKLCKVYLINLKVAVKTKNPRLVQYNEDLLIVYSNLINHEITIKNA